MKKIYLIKLSRYFRLISFFYECFHNPGKNGWVTLKKIAWEVCGSERKGIRLGKEMQKTNNCTRFPHSMRDSFRQMDFFQNLR
jgi:hypothetical protein